VTDMRSAHKILVEKLGGKLHLCPRRMYSIVIDLKELVSETVLIWFGLTGSSRLL
jgi:hypothetical protein